MKILFLTQYFPPEVGAPQNRIFEFARQLKDFGNDITVITAFPNYPRGEIFEDYKSKKIFIEEMNGIKVIRTSIYVTKDKSFTKRLRNYLSFTFSSVFQGAKYIGKQDILITESPPLFLGWSGYILSKISGSKFVFNVSDLWPESAVKLGVLNNKLFIKMSTWLEESCYRKADAITGQTQGIVDNIISRGFNKSKVHIITNGIDLNLFKKENRDNSLRKELDIDSKFAVCYAGIHGIAQGLEVIIDAAERLKENSNIQFVFIGDGPEKEKLILLKKSKKLNNITFLPIQPKKYMPKLIASMDATIIPLKRLDLFKGALPSKMFECLASELPIILGVEGEAEQLIKNANAGIVVEPENSREIAEAVVKLYRDTDLRAKMGQSGRLYVRENYDREIISKRLEEILKNL